MSIVEGKEGWFFVFFLKKKMGGGKEVVWRVEAGGAEGGHRCYLHCRGDRRQEPLG